jgi:hypothetical protein
MGLAPYIVKLGNKICLLKEIQFPIILKPQEDY